MAPRLKHRLETAGQFVTILGSIITIAVGIVTYFVTTSRAQGIADERAGYHETRITTLETGAAKEHDAIAGIRADIREIKTDLKHLLERK